MLPLLPALAHRPAVVKETMLGAIATKLIESGSEIVSIYHRR